MLSLYHIVGIVGTSSNGWENFEREMTRKYISVYAQRVCDPEPIIPTIAGGFS